MRRRVLLVDDEAELVPTLVERLELRGYEATGVLSGDEGMRRIDGEDFDVVVLDLRMPGLGGMEMTRRLARDRPGLPIVILSGDVSEEDERAVLREGAAAYLAKPIDIKELVRTIREVLGEEEA